MAEPKTVTALAPDGTPIEVPATEAAALARGQEGRVLSDAEAAKVRHQVELQKKYDGAEGYIAPPLVGAARGLSFGLSDLMLSEVPGMQKRLADYEEYAPQATSTGEVAGMLGGALTGVGAPALAEHLGVGAAERLGAKGLAGSILRGGVEGSVFGAGDALSESALSDHGLSAEALIGGAAYGALGGAVANGALGLVGKGLSGLRLGRMADGFEGLAANKYGEAAEGVGKKLAEVEGEAASTTHGGPYRAPGGLADDVAGAYIDNLPTASATERAKYAEAWAARDRVLSKGAETVENASRTFSNALNDAVKAGREVDMASFGESKVNQMSKLVDKSKASAQAERVYNWLLDADPMVKKLSTDANSAMTAGDLKQWNGWVKELAGAIESQDSLQMHTSLDEMKRWVGKQAEFGKGPFGLTRAAREFDDLYQGSKGLKGLLEDNVWGEKAAAAQRNVNAATTNLLSEGRRFQQQFTTQFGSEAGRPLYAADTAKVSSFMNKLTTASNDLDAQSVEQWIGARRHFLDATSRSYEHSDATLNAVNRERAALDKLDAVYRDTTKEVGLTNQVRAALAEERERGIGGAVGAVLDIAAKPYTTLQRLAQIESQTRGVLRNIGSGTKELLSGSKPVATAGKPSGAGKFFSGLLDGVSNFAEGMKNQLPVAASAAGALASRRLFNRRAEQIGVLQSNPSAVADRLQKSLQPIEQASPSVTKEATEVALRGVDFLASKLPPSRQDQYSLQPQLQAGSRASDAEISRFMRFSDAVDDPLVVLREARSGTLTRDHVEAVKAVYPKLYDEIRGAVMGALVESKSELPYARRIQLGILLDIPTDKTLSPDFMRAIQASYSVDQAGAEPPPQTAASPDIAGSFQTATQSATERAK